MSQQTLVRRGLPLMLLTAALGIASCIQIEDGSKKAKIDTVSSGAVIDPPDPKAASPMPDAYGPDSATPVRGAGPVAIQRALAADTAHPLEVVDSTPAAAPNDADLAILARELTIPLPGIAKSALHDSYGELRGGTRPHEALDILAPRGTPVLSATNGRVLKLFDSKAGGLMVYAADSTERFILMYGHLDAYQPGLAEGQPLRRGQQIGVVGTTGNAAPDAPHLHFAIARSSDVKQWWKGMPVNPYPLLAR
jgi:murein DD-endopeptidase MepM/ murein hydrolase activator NlpD